MKTKSFVFLSCLLGGIICWYDFFIFAIATSIVFGKVFFPTMSFLIPMLAFAVGFLTRPIGSFIFGHYGDRFGRKPTLVFTLIITAIATVGIGLLPAYAAIGVAAPILLFALRIIQTIAFGGEWAATSTIVAEYNAKSKHRGFWGGFLMSQLPIGLIMATAMFMFATHISGSAFLDWGWRIPFLFSSVLFVVGIFARIKMIETPEFNKIKETNNLEKAPVLTVFKNHWREILLSIFSFQVGGSYDKAIQVFGVAYLVNTLHMARGPLTEIMFKVSFISLLAVILYGWISDWLANRNKISPRLGQLRQWQVAGVLGIIAAYPIFYWLSQGILIWPLLIGVVGISMINWGPAVVILTELFPTNVRQTGTGTVFTLAGIVSGGLIPLLCTAVVEYTGNIMSLVWVFLGLSIISVLCSFGLTRVKSTLDA